MCHHVLDLRKDDNASDDVDVFAKLRWLLIPTRTLWLCLMISRSFLVGAPTGFLSSWLPDTRATWQISNTQTAESVGSGALEARGQIAEE